MIKKILEDLVAIENFRNQAIQRLFSLEQDIVEKIESESKKSVEENLEIFKLEFVSSIETRLASIEARSASIEAKLKKMVEVLKDEEWQQKTK
jgi:hypothetical protein